PLRSTPFPYTTLFRSEVEDLGAVVLPAAILGGHENVAKLDGCLMVENVRDVSGGLVDFNVREVHVRGTGLSSLIELSPCLSILRSEEHTSELQSRGHL